MRRALEYAVDKAAIVQVRGGPLLARPLHQVGVEGSAGFRRGYAPYATATNHGDPDRARQLLHSAGLGPYDTLRILLANSYGREVIALQEALRKAGVAAVIVRTSGSDDYYNNYLLKPEATRRGDWDIALNDSFPIGGGSTTGVPRSRRALMVGAPSRNDRREVSPVRWRLRQPHVAARIFAATSRSAPAP